MSSGEKDMKRTIENMAKVVEKKERAAWRCLNYVEEKYGKESVERQRALAEWAALQSVRLMFENQEVFDHAYETWMKD